MEAAGCYGRNCADDVSADAALLSRATGVPVRVQLTREQEHVWEPKGTGQLLEVDVASRRRQRRSLLFSRLDIPRTIADARHFCSPTPYRPFPRSSAWGIAPAIPPYEFDAMRVVVHDMATDRACIMAPGRVGTPEHIRA